MQVPVYGNTAYKYEETQRVPERKIVRKVRVHKKKKTALGSMVLLLTALAVAFGILFTNSQLIEKNAKIKELEKNLDTLRAQAVAGQFAIERDMDLNKIEDEAVGRLGMQRPTKAQMVYVDMQNNDYVEKAGTKEEKKADFKIFVDSILEYFS